MHNVKHWHAFLYRYVVQYPNIQSPGNGYRDGCIGVVGMLCTRVSWVKCRYYYCNTYIY